MRLTAIKDPLKGIYFLHSARLLLYPLAKLAQIWVKTTQTLHAPVSPSFPLLSFCLTIYRKIHEIFCIVIQMSTELWLDVDEIHQLFINREMFI